MGRKMSSQSRGRPLPSTYRSNVETWFHEDNTPAPGLPATASRPKKSFEYDVSTVQPPWELCISTAPAASMGLPVGGEESWIQDRDRRI